MSEVEPKESVGELILLLAAVVIIVLIMLPIFEGFRFERFEGSEVRLGYTGSTDLGIGAYQPKRLNTNNDLRRIDRVGAHYVSEIACTIAEDIYYDFTRFGEAGRDSSLLYKGPSNAFDDENICEWVWEKPCCPAPSGTVSDMMAQGKGGYRCLINSDVFSVEAGEVLAPADKTELEDMGCYVECGLGDPLTEYRLDEVCVNKNLANKLFPLESSISFCTDEDVEYLIIDYGSDRERQKFGNDPSYGDTNNPPGWISSVDCVAGGERYNGEDLTDRDTDRIYKWVVDDDTNIERSSDRNLDTLNNIVTDKKYFYTLYWNNNDDEDYDASRRYEVEFPSFINNDYTIVDETFDNKADFLTFITSFFDEEEDLRITTAGRWFPELRTHFDGIVTFGLGGGATITEIFNALEGEDYGMVYPYKSFIGYEELCTYNIDCQDYNLKTSVWEEALGQNTDGACIWIWPFPELHETCIADDDKTWPYPYESPVILKHTKNIDSSGIGWELDNKKYRIIIRNWVSNWYGLETEECPNDSNHWWCLHEDGAAGKKITCSDTKDGCDRTSITTYSRPPNARPLLKLEYHKVTDRAIIIIQLPTCEETVPDGGIDASEYGEITVEDEIIEPQVYKDECEDDRYLIERYCNSVGEALYERIDCSPGVCVGGECV